MLISCQSSHVSDSDGHSMVDYYIRSSNIEVWSFVPREKHQEVIEKFAGDELWHYSQDKTDDYNRYIITTGDIYYVVWYKSKNVKEFESPCFGQDYYYDDVIHHFKCFKFLNTNSNENKLMDEELSQRDLMDKIISLEYLTKNKSL